jgi:hypothetical protein
VALTVEEHLVRLRESLLPLAKRYGRVLSGALATLKRYASLRARRSSDHGPRGYPSGSSNASRGAPVHNDDRGKVGNPTPMGPSPGPGATGEMRRNRKFDPADRRVGQPRLPAAKFPARRKFFAT